MCETRVVSQNMLFWGKYVVFGMDVRVAPKFWLRGILSGTLAGLQTLASTSHYKFHTLPHMRIWNWKAYFTLQIPYSAAYGSMELEGVLHITNSILCRIWEYAIGRWRREIMRRCFSNPSPCYFHPHPMPFSTLSFSQGTRPTPQWMRRSPRCGLNARGSSPWRD